MLLLPSAETGVELTESSFVWLYIVIIGLCVAYMLVGVHAIWRCSSSTCTQNRKNTIRVHFKPVLLAHTMAGHVLVSPRSPHTYIP